MSARRRDEPSNGFSRIWKNTLAGVVDRSHPSKSGTATEVKSNSHPISDATQAEKVYTVNLSEQKHLNESNNNQIMYPEKDFTKRPSLLKHLNLNQNEITSPSALARNGHSDKGGYEAKNVNDTSSRFGKHNDRRSDDCNKQRFNNGPTSKFARKAFPSASARNREDTLQSVVDFKPTNRNDRTSSFTNRVFHTKPKTTLVKPVEKDWDEEESKSSSNNISKQLVSEDTAPDCVTKELPSEETCSNTKSKQLALESERTVSVSVSNDPEENSAIASLPLPGSFLNSMRSLFHSYNSPDATRTADEFVDKDTSQTAPVEALNFESDSEVDSNSKVCEERLENNHVSNHSPKSVCVDDDSRFDDQTLVEEEDDDTKRLNNDDIVSTPSSPPNNCEENEQSCVNNLRLSHLTAAEFKSPSSIPSGFSSDYDYGAVSHSQSEAEDESPHPLSENLYSQYRSTTSPDPQGDDSEYTNAPSSNPNITQHSQDSSEPEHTHSNSRWPSHYQQGMHPQYPHPTWYNQPYNSDPYYQPNPYPHYYGSYNMGPSGSQPHPRPHYPHSKDIFTVPAESLSETDTINKLSEFVSSRKQDLEKSMPHIHGHAGTFEVIVKVVCRGSVDPQAAYPSNPMWRYPMMPPMGYPGHPPFWPYPGYPSANRDPNAYHAPTSQWPTDGMEDVSSTGNDQQKLYQKVGLSNPTRTENNPVYDNFSDIEEEEDEEMKRRAIFPENHDGDSDDSNTNNESNRRNKVSKKKRKSDDHEESVLTEKAANNSRKAKSNSHSLNRSANSVSNFLNPDNLHNDWKTPPRMQRSKSSLETKPALSDPSPSTLEKRDSSSERKSKSNQYEDKQTSSQSNDASITSFKEKSVCVVERKSDGQTADEPPLDFENDGIEPVSGRWFEMCPEPPVEKCLPSLPSSSEPTVEKQSSEEFGGHNRRRSDSVVRYNAEEQHYFARDFRLCKTPGARLNQNNSRNPDIDSSWKISFKERSKNYRYQFIDTHCHIDFLYNRSLPQHKMNMPWSEFMRENNETFPVNYGGCVAVFCNPWVLEPNSRPNRVLMQVSREQTVWIAVGCHPKSVLEFKEDSIFKLRDLLTECPRIVALGEIGLDYSRDFKRHEVVQKDVFKQQLHLAIELKLPLVIHCRDADDDCLHIMKEMVPPDHKIHLHCFTRDMHVANRWLDHFSNLYVGFTPVITYSSAREAIQAACRIPLDRLLLETDAPYFVPTGVPNTHLSGMSHPGLALYTAEKLAQLRSVDVDTILRACRANTKKMYGI